MKIHRKHFFVLIFLLLTFYSFSQDKISRGLYFQSFEVDQDKRTGLNLTPDSKLTFTNGFVLKFDIKLRKNPNDYGYVFRLVGNDSLNIDLLTHITTTDHLSDYAFSLVSGTSSLIKVRNSEIKNVKGSSWMTVFLIYNKSTDNITLRINAFKKSVPLKTNKLTSFQLYFGLNNNTIFATTDVPPMTIRNIQLYDEKNELKRNWKLEKHALDNVYDECQNKKAITVNPVWEIDKHVKWQLRTQMVIPYDLPQFACNEEAGRIYIAKHDAVYVYDAVKQKPDTIKVRKGEPYNCSSNQMFYDKNTRQLVSYNFDNAHLARYDFESNEWTNEFSQHITPQFWHHSKYFDAQDSVLMTIGGYGYHKYKSDVMRYSMKTREWNQHDISPSISPRYLGSLGYLGNNELLYFGGFGSKSGNQVEFPHNYYDLYKINSKTLEVKKLWEMNAPVEHFTNSNSLVVNRNSNTFYNLAYSNTRYKTSLKLVEYSISKPEFKLVADSIPYKFKDIESYCDLYYSPKTAELLALTSVSKNGKTEISIYAIAYPPLHAEDVMQVETTKSKLGWLFLIIPLLLFPALYFAKKHKDKKDRLKNNVNTYLNFEYSSFKPELKSSSINMLGYFQLIDKDGVNITGNFTATTSQILVLIILYTVKNGQGISTQELTEILWPEKDTDSARNNRNVYMSKLRLLIKNVGDIELINQNNYWSANIGNDVFCDYKNVMLLIDEVKKQQNPAPELINEFVNIASRGVLLPNFQEEWIDSFKGDYTSLVIETLSGLLMNKLFKNDQLLVLRITDAILKHDSIDEEIVKLKVTTLFQLGKKSQAKQCYDKFVEDYKNFMGVAYKESFEAFRDARV